MKLFIHLFILLVVLLTHSSRLSAQKSALKIEKAEPVFEMGEAQIVPAFKKKWIKEECWVETTFDSDEDGKLDRMHVYIVRPPQTEVYDLKLPAIYVSSPYFGGNGGNKKSFFWDVKHEIGAIPPSHDHPNVKQKSKMPWHLFLFNHTWIKRGYVMVYSSSPGTGLSDGVPTIGGENESLAPKAVIEWLGGRAEAYTTRTGNEKVKADWCTGKVGMTGTSYNGSLCLAAATTGVEGLEVIIPVAPVASFYQYYRSNGLVRSPGGYVGEDADVLYDFVNSGDPSKRASNDQKVRDEILVPGQDRITGDYNEFWAARNYITQIDKMKAAMLMAHGFNDWNVMPEHSYQFYKAAQAKGLPTQIYYTQGGHGDAPPTNMMNRWFTKYLHGIDNDADKGAKAWIVREFANFAKPYEDFPDPRVSPVKLYLNAGNPTNGQLSTTKTENQKTESWIDNAKYKAKKLAKDDDSKHRLLYVTPELQKNIRLSGVPKVNIKLACNKAAANLSVYLVSLPWTSGKIYENIITRGWADPQNHSSIENGTPLASDQFYDVKFDLMPDDQVIFQGQKIGLMIFSSDPEFTLQPKAGTELTIDLEETYIELPILGGIKEFNKAIQK